MLKVILTFLALIALPSEAHAVTALVGVLAAALGGGLIATAVAYAVVSFAVSYIINKVFAPEQDERQAPADQGVKQRIPTDPRNKLPVVYGTKSVAGQITYASISSNNQKMAFIISLAEGPVNAITEVKWEDKTLSFSGGLSTTSLNQVSGATPDAGGSDDFLNGGRFKVRVFPNGGTCGPMESFDSKWNTSGSSRTMPNTAYAYCELTYDQEKRVTSLTNRLQFKVEGRTVKTISSSTTAATYLSANEPSVGLGVNSNPADIVIDYLTNERYGAGVPLSAIDFSSFNDHKVYCADTSAKYFDTGGTERSGKKRFTTNGVINTNQDVDQNVSDLTIGNAGFLTWNYGQFGIVTDKEKDSIGLRTADSLPDFDESNIFGKIQISKLGFDNKLNELTVKFDSDTALEQEEQLIQTVPTARRNDNEPVLERTVTLPMTNNAIEAGRVSSIYLDKSRQDLLVTFTTSLEASGIESGDVITVSHATPGWVDKEFLVQSVEEKVVNNIIGLEIVAQEYADSTYNFRVDEIDTAPNTSLPNPFKSPDITNLDSAEDTSLDEPNLTIDWDEDVDSVLVGSSEIGYRNTNASTDTLGSYTYNTAGTSLTVVAGGVDNFPIAGTILVGVTTTTDAEGDDIIVNAGILLPYTGVVGGNTFTIDTTNANNLVIANDSTVTLPLTFKSTSGGTIYELSPLIASAEYHTQITAVSTLGNRSKTLYDTTTLGVARVIGEQGEDGPKGDDGDPGDPGVAGSEGLSERSIYRNVDEIPATPTDGGYNPTSRVLTPPTDWNLNADPSNLTQRWVSRTVLDPSDLTANVDNRAAVTAVTFDNTGITGEASETTAAVAEEGFFDVSGTTSGTSTTGTTELSTITPTPSNGVTGTFTDAIEVQQIDSSGTRSNVFSAGTSEEVVTLSIIDTFDAGVAAAGAQALTLPADSDTLEQPTGGEGNFQACWPSGDLSVGGSAGTAWDYDDSTAGACNFAINVGGDPGGNFGTLTNTSGSAVTLTNQPFSCTIEIDSIDSSDGHTTPKLQIAKSLLSFASDFSNLAFFNSSGGKIDTTDVPGSFTASSINTKTLVLANNDSLLLYINEGSGNDAGMEFRVTNFTLGEASDPILTVSYNLDIDTADVVPALTGTLSESFADNDTAVLALEQIRDETIVMFPTITAGDIFDENLPFSVSNTTSWFRDLEGRVTSLANGDQLFQGQWDLRAGENFAGLSVTYFDWNGWIGNWFHIDATDTEFQTVFDLITSNVATPDASSDTILYPVVNAVLTLTDSNNSDNRLVANVSNIAENFQETFEITSIVSQSGTPPSLFAGDQTDLSVLISTVGDVPVTLTTISVDDASIFTATGAVVLAGGEIFTYDTLDTGVTPNTLTDGTGTGSVFTVGVGVGTPVYQLDATNTGWIVNFTLDVPHKSISLDTNQTGNISQSFSLTQNSGTNAQASITAVNGNPANDVPSTYTVSDYASNQITSFTASVSDPSESDIATVLSNIETVINDNTESPKNFTAAISSGNIVLTAADAGPVDGVFSVTSSHGGPTSGRGNISFDPAVVTTEGRTGVSTTWTVSINGVSYSGEFSSGANATTQASELATLLSAEVSGLASPPFTATADSGVVTITAKQVGNQTNTTRLYSTGGTDQTATQPTLSITDGTSLASTQDTISLDFRGTDYPPIVINELDSGANLASVVTAITGLNIPLITLVQDDTFDVGNNTLSAGASRIKFTYTKAGDSTDTASDGVTITTGDTGGDLAVTTVTTVTQGANAIYDATRTTWTAVIDGVTYTGVLGSGSNATQSATEVAALLNVELP